ERSRHGLSSNAVIDIEAEEGKTAVIRSTVQYSTETKKTQTVLYFAGFNPATFARQSEKMKTFSGVNLPLKGSLSFGLNESFKPGLVRFVLGADPGVFSGFGLYEVPIKIEHLYMAGY